MGVGEAFEPAVRSGRRLDQGDRPFRRRVVDNVELVVLLKDHPLVRRPGIDIRDIFRARLAETGECRLLPVVALLPDEPGAVRVKALERVGTDAYRRIEVVFAGFRLLLEDVLRHDPGRAPAYRKGRVET